MLIQFTLQDLMIFLVCAIGIIAGVLSLPILWDLKKVTGACRSLLETNQEAIKITIRTLPVVLENMEHVSGNVRETTDRLKVSVPMLLQEVENAASAAKGSIELTGEMIENIGSEINDTIASYKKTSSDYVAYFHIFEEVLQIICRTLSSSKQNEG
jgi:ABC-type transporter Mla subunit MlaD